MQHEDFLFLSFRVKERSCIKKTDLFWLQHLVIMTEL